MKEKEKYVNIYKGYHVDNQVDIIPGKMGGGYGRICWGENMLESLKQWKTNSLLDVGCGYGNFCDAASLFVPRVYGLDIASVATGNVIDNPEVTYFDGEAKSLPLPDNGVEWITSFDCLEHCLEEDIDKILDEFNRVATKGFVLSISYEPCEMDSMSLHMTVKPESWWLYKLSKYGEVTKHGRVPITGAPYLICRKPVAQNVICYCAGGIGPRLRALAWADELARRTARKLIMLWLPDDPLCRIAFSELFSNRIPEITQEALLESSSCKIYANVKEVADQALISGGKSLRKVVQKWGCIDPKSLSMDDVEENIVIYAPHPDSWSPLETDFRLIKQLSPVPSVRGRIQSAISRLNLDKRFIGVHARGTDFGIHVEAYAQQMERAVGEASGQRFLVVSEDETYEQQLKQHFHQNVVKRNKSSWGQKIDENKPWTLDNIDSSKASAIEALIDLYLLANTDFRIYHESSAFAQLAVVLSKVNPYAPADIDPVNPAKPNIQANNSVSNIHSGTTKSTMPLSKNKATTSKNTLTKDTPYTIYYFCPDIQVKSAGIRRIYRHVSLLRDAGFPVFIMHEKTGFQMQNMPPVPITYLDQVNHDDRAVFVIPEGMPRIMHQLKNHPGRKFVIALGWSYIFHTLPNGLDWRHLNIERVIATSPWTGRLITWSMRLPVHQVASSIDHQRYYYDPVEKQKQIAYISRKASHVEKLMRLLGSRNPDYINKIRWVGMDRLSQDDYAAQIRGSWVFVNTSIAEGFPTSFLEVMAAGALFAGYNSVGGKELLCGQGLNQNCVIAPNGDYLSLAYAMEPVLDDLINSKMNRWSDIIACGRRAASVYTAAKEAEDVIRFWHRFNTND